MVLFECVEFGEDLNRLFEIYINTNIEKEHLKEENEMIREEKAQLFSQIKELKEEIEKMKE